VLEVYRKIGETLAGLNPWVNVALFVGLFVGGTGIAVAAVVWLPADHFRSGPRPRAAHRHPVVHALLIFSKNVLGYAILPLGVLMALPLIPGPGLVFIVIGLSLIDFPGKKKLERRLLLRPAVHRFIDDLRRRFGRPPLIFD
jgi:hypothetical protein